MEEAVNTELMFFGMSAFSILAIAVAVWLLTQKSTRQAVGKSVTDTVTVTGSALVSSAKMLKESVDNSRAIAYKEALEEIGNIQEMLQNMESAYHSPTGTKTKE